MPVLWKRMEGKEKGRVHAMVTGRTSRTSHEPGWPTSGAGSAEGAPEPSSIEQKYIENKTASDFLTSLVQKIWLWRLFSGKLTAHQKDDLSGNSLFCGPLEIKKDRRTEPET